MYCPHKHALFLKSETLGLKLDTNKFLTRHFSKSMSEILKPLSSS